CNDLALAALLPLPLPGALPICHRVRRPRPEGQVPPLDPPECLHRHGHRLPTRPSHDISRTTSCGVARVPWRWISLYWSPRPAGRSEEHTSELQSRENLVCRLLL